MEIHQIRYFLAVAETKNFSRAAERCFVSQPSLSQQIMKLEKELGYALFERSNKQVRLTVAGEALLPRATAILGNLDGVRDHVARAVDGGMGHVSIGAIPTIAPYLLPEVIKRFRKRCPKAQVTVYECLTEELMARIAEGEVDVGILSTPLPNESLDVRDVLTEPMMVCLHHEHELAGRPSVTMEELQGEPAIVLHPMHCLGQQIQSFCHERDFCPNVVCFSTQILTVQAMVSLKIGYSIMPRMCARAEKNDVRAYVPIRGDGPSRLITIAWRKGRELPRLAQMMHEQVLAVCAKLRD